MGIDFLVRIQYYYSPSSASNELIKHITKCSMSKSLIRIDLIYLRGIQYTVCVRISPSQDSDIFLVMFHTM